MAASFAKRSIKPMLKEGSSDGDLSMISGILKEAMDTGLMTAPDKNSAGYEAGIWGVNTLTEGPEVSLMLLEELAAACAGIAMNVHSAGLGSLVLGMAENEIDNLPDKCAVALSEGGFPPGPGTMMDPSADAPAKIETMASEENGNYIINGAKHFVYHPKDAKAFIVFARTGNKWVVLMVPSDAEGIETGSAGHRMGLRACPLSDLIFNNVTVPSSARLEFNVPVCDVVMEYLRLWMLGTLAISAGVVRTAMSEAVTYACERYQGCTEIINHPIVNMSLLADTEARLRVCQALLQKASQKNGPVKKAVLDAAKAKLAGSIDAAKAVTDSLQVFGGYGYMEDYPMTKLYRDINTLKCAGGGPRDMRVIIAGLSREA